MKVILNSVDIETSAANLQQLICDLDLPMAGLAVAVGSKVVRRDEWENTPLKEGVVITLIRATQGG